jgi:hypothetical protein
MAAELKHRFAVVNRKRIYTAGAALLIAGAAGHFMQKTATAPRSAAPVVAAAASLAPPIIASAPVEAAMDVVAQPIALEEQQAALPTATEAPETIVPAEAEVTRATAVPDAIMTASDRAKAAAAEAFDLVQQRVAPQVALAPSYDIAAADELGDMAAEPAPPETSCDITISAVAEAAALAAISLAAPCNSGEDVTFAHAGLTFSEQLGPDGDLFILVPVMAEHAAFTVTFADGQEKAVELVVPDLAGYERVALVWKGATGLQLHALENGADYGEDGHIWAETPADPDAASSGAGGFLSVLGSTADGYAADVYTYPTALMPGAEPVVSVEAEVMENTCATEIKGTILRSNRQGEPVMQPLTMAVPGCDAVGEYLVLKNLPQDLKLARN